MRAAGRAHLVSSRAARVSVLVYPWLPWCSCQKLDVVLEPAGAFVALVSPSFLQKIPKLMSFLLLTYKTIAAHLLTVKVECTQSDSLYAHLEPEAETSAHALRMFAFLVLCQVLSLVRG